MNYGVWARSAALYSTLLDDHEEEKKDREYERKKKLIDYEIAKKSALEHQKGIPPNDQKLDELILEVKSLRSKTHG